MKQMKKLIFILTLVVTFSCSSDLTNLNVDTKNAVVAPGETLFSNAQKNFVDFMQSTNVNLNNYKMFAQYWTETTYTDEANYDQGRAIPRNQWNALYRDVLKDLKEASTNIAADVDPLADPQITVNKQAMIEIMNVYTYKVLVDTFGDIPYTEALDIDNVNPVYDDAATIYADLLSRLNAAIANLDPSFDGMGSADLFYSGNVTNWIKFGNALKLQFGVMMGDAATVSAAAADTFTSNADNATLEYLPTTPNTNPLWVDLVQSGRSDFVVADTFVDKIVPLNDPRTSVFLDDNIVPYTGGPYGDNNSFNSYTHIGPTLEEPTFAGTIFSFAETEFLKAEAVEMGLLTTGTAETYYNNGVTASIEEWGGTAAEASTYLAQSSVAYTTATPSWQETIGNQVWFALYGRGFAAWTQWRFLNYPTLNVAVGSGLPVPLRLTYPVVEQTLNATNYAAAASNIGGDNLDTPLFWDN